MSPGRAFFVFALSMTLSACASVAGTGARRPSPFPEPASKPEIFQPAPSDVGAMNPIDTDSFVASAEKLRGVHYQLGGDSPKTGFDCSGYIKYVYGLYRIPLPRTVAEQVQSGKPAIGSIRPGDLLFFKMNGPKSPVSHVALAISADEFIHAPGADGAVRTEKLSTYWRSRLVTARRIL
jgi:murein DD-endopeptidase